MLHITLTVIHDSAPDISLTGEISNVSNLDTISDYEFAFGGRAGCGPLTGYPRWSESSLGLVSHCIALTTHDSDSMALRPNWRKLSLQIDLWPGGRSSRASRLVRLAVDRTGDGFDVRYVEEPNLIWGQVAGVARSAYSDPWDLADHAARIVIFGADELPPAKPLDVSIREGMVFAANLPAYTRSAFGHRQRHSGRPWHRDGDAYFWWDFRDWLNGVR